MEEINFTEYEMKQAEDIGEEIVCKSCNEQEDKWCSECEKYMARRDVELYKIVIKRKDTEISEWKGIAARLRAEIDINRHTRGLIIRNL